MIAPTMIRQIGASTQSFTVRFPKLTRLVAMQQQQNDKVVSSASGGPIEPRNAKVIETALQRLNLRVLENADSGVAQPQTAQSGRRVYVARHAERVDFTFGSWVPYSFNDAGEYVRKDLNMPKSLPPRSPNIWQQDTPLTNLGCYQARLTGEAMKEAGVRIDHVFCSPAFRCVQTAASIIEGLGLRESLPIRIEPGLLEWLTWYPAGIPTYLSNDELTSAGINAAKNYTPLTSVEDLKQSMKESFEAFCSRNAELSKQLIKATEGNILIVGHAATLETCTSAFVHPDIPLTRDLLKRILKFSYCSIVMMESVDGSWKMTRPPCAPFTNSKNDRFDWKDLS
ncbi:ecdysteroid-phosphate phosphatase-like [Wyeomyia smithii]|uniref:ecdysteroid-phosphate phosphatase-like n=1 Tax=Wyeomyia smithii TaxID=174621 RepID=UPI00246804BF|nr:ecdysteroid-phosphate phosphatase-like [Wyeomyia smithii]